MLRHKITRTEEPLIGIGLYTPAEAEHLIGVPAQRIIRWLRGHAAHGKQYDPLWIPQIQLGDGHVYLGFRDLMEMRVANAFIARGLSAQKVRRAIQIAKPLLREEHPLSTAKFRTDGRSVFLQVLREDGSNVLIDLFKSQYAFKEVVERSLKNIEFDDSGIPARWWPLGKAAGIVVDPERSFGAPIETRSGVRASILAEAVDAEGSEEAAARVWDVPAVAVRRAVAFRDTYLRQAA